MDAKLPAELPNLILEELTQGLNKPQTLSVNHALGQSSNVVMGLFTVSVCPGPTPNQHTGVGEELEHRETSPSGRVYGTKLRTLIVAEGPLKEMLSIMSGYSVPWRNYTSGTSVDSLLLLASLNSSHDPYTYPLDFSCIGRILGFRLNPDSLLFEDIDEEISNYFALPFWVDDALEGIEEPLAGIHYSKRDAEVLREGLLDLLTLIETHKTIVNELGR